MKKTHVFSIALEALPEYRQIATTRQKSGLLQKQLRIGMHQIRQGLCNRKGMLHMRRKTSSTLWPRNSMGPAKPGEHSHTTG